VKEITDADAEEEAGNCKESKNRVLLIVDERNGTGRNERSKDG